MTKSDTQNDGEGSPSLSDITIRRLYERLAAKDAELAELRSYRKRIEGVAGTKSVENIMNANCAREFIAGLIDADCWKAKEIERLKDELAAYKEDVK